MCVKDFFIVVVPAMRVFGMFCLLQLDFGYMASSSV
jgi:hypothetical protein